MITNDLRRGRIMKITRLLVAASFASIIAGASPSLLAQETPPAAAMPTTAAPSAETIPDETPPVEVPPVEAPAVAAPAPMIVSFIDLQAFDDDLNDQLGKAGERLIEIEFYTQVTPNQIPSRIERRLAALRKEGGRVGVVQPQSASGTRSITAAVGLFSGLWNFMKTFEAAANERALVRSVRDRDADIVLERDSQGAYFIRKIVFKKRPPAESAAAG